MLAEFDPDRLQEQFDRQPSRGALLRVPAKLRYWDLYRDKCRDMVKDPEASFRKLVRRGVRKGVRRAAQAAEGRRRGRGPNGTHEAATVEIGR